MASSDDTLLTYKEAAFETGLSYGTIRTYASCGKLEVVRDLKFRPYIRTSDIKHLIKELP